MKNKLYVLLVVAFVALTLFLGNWGLTDSSEARYAEIGKEMFASKDYVNPTLLGIKHMHKPPVTYYITAFGYELFGVNEFAARFFMQLALVAQLFLVFKITMLLYKNEKMAFAAALIYFSFPISVIAVRTLTTDAYLTTFILAAIYSWLQYKKDKSVYLLYAFYIFLGLIFETKGPVGFIVPLTFIITHKIIYKEKIETSWHQLFGFILFLGISASWYLVAMNHNEGLFDYFFNNQLVERVSENKFKRGKPFWYYFLIMPLIGLPWLFYLVSYFKNNLKEILQKKKTDFILLVTFLVLFIVLTLSTSKLPLYILPLFFILAIFSAKHLMLISEKSIKIKSIIAFLSIVIISLAIAIASFLSLDISINSTYAIIVFALFSVVAFMVCKKVKNTNFLKPAYLGVLFICTIIMSSNHIFKDNELKINSVKPITEFIEANSNEKPQIFVYNYLLPSISFYLDQDFTTINHGRYTTQREIQFETNDNWKKNLINYFDKNDRARLQNVNTEKPTFIIKRKKDAMPDTLQVLVNKLKNRKEFEIFEVYY